MKTIKRLTTFICAVAVCLSLPITPASAAPVESGIGRVLTDDAVFYSHPENNQDKAYFLLTNTYYIDIININAEGDFYPVEYNAPFESGYSKLTGYVLKSCITLWEEEYTQPMYPQIFAVAMSGASIYVRPRSAETLEDGTLNTQITLLYSQALLVYGKITDNSENRDYYFVKYGDASSKLYFGYVPADRLSVSLPPAHPDPLPLPPQPEPSEDPVTTPPATEPAQQTPADDKYQIILIVAICIPALFVVYLMFKPSAKKRRYRHYYDDMDEA